MDETEIIRKLELLQEAVGALAGYVSEMNYRIGELEKRK